MTYILTFLLYYIIYTLGVFLATKCVKWVNYIDNNKNPKDIFKISGKNKSFGTDLLDNWLAYLSWLTVAGTLILAIIIYILKPIVKFIFYPARMAVKKLND